jgi:hypothetical protein
MRKFLALTLMLVPSVATAQVGPALPGYLYTPYPLGTDNGSDDTPTMRRDKLRRAIALRSEAAALVVEDGGTLTPDHQAYIQRQRRAILLGVK